MTKALPPRLKLFATGSLAASAALLAIAFLTQSLAAVQAGIVANWCLFIVASFFAVLPVPKWRTFSRTDRARLSVWLVLFLAFTAASWTAVLLLPR